MHTIKYQVDSKTRLTDLPVLALRKYRLVVLVQRFTHPVVSLCQLRVRLGDNRPGLVAVHSQHYRLLKCHSFNTYEYQHFIFWELLSVNSFYSFNASSSDIVSQFVHFREIQF